MRGPRKEHWIEAYVEAVIERDAFARALAEEGETPERLRLLKEAKAMVTERMRCLTGSDLGEAARRLATRRAVPA